MKPVSPDSDNDDLQPPNSKIDSQTGSQTGSQRPAGQAFDRPGTASSGSTSLGSTSSDASDSVYPSAPPSAPAGSFGQTSFGLIGDSDANASVDSLTPLAALQRQYAEELAQEIEQLEAERTRLRAEVAALKHDYTLMQTRISSLQQTASLIANPRQANSQQATGSIAGASDELSVTERLWSVENTPLESSPRLPGEPEIPPGAVVDRGASQSRRIELPMPATSEQRRQQFVRGQKDAGSKLKSRMGRGLVLSAIATLVTAWHYGLVGTLHQGGSWLGTSIGQLGVGFVPAVALLWLRMLVMVPALVMLAPQLHRTTWEDLQNWFYTDEQRFLPLVGSGIALFFSQAFLYQSIGSAGFVVATALFFLYPISAVLLGLGLRRDQALTPFGILAIVAIAMGGFLVAKPAISASSPTAVWLGLLASIASGCYIVLTNLGYQQQCHPIPTAVVQFSTVATLSSLVLLVKPLRLVSISWSSFCLWGLLIGVLMLVAYLFIYSSLRLIGAKTAMVVAATPLVSLLLSGSFVPSTTLEIIQWTGILLVSIGGIALGKEKAASEKLA